MYGTSESFSAEVSQRQNTINPKGGIHVFDDLVAIVVLHFKHHGPNTNEKPQSDGTPYLTSDPAAFYGLTRDICLFDNTVGIVYLYTGS